MKKKTLQKLLSYIGLVAMVAYLFPLVPPQYSPVSVKQAQALTDPGTFTNVSVSSTSSTAGEATTITVNFTTENNLSGSGNGDIVRVGFDRFEYNTSNPTLTNMTVNGSPFSDYSNTFGYYTYSGYYEIHLDTNLAGGSAISMTFTGMINSTIYDLQWIGLVTFSPDNGGTAYENCVDAGSGATTDYCPSYRAYLPLGTPSIKGRLLGPVGTAQATVGVPEASINIWNDNHWDYGYSDGLGYFYFFDAPTGSDYQMDFQKPWGVGYQYSPPAKLNNVAVSSGSTNDLGVIRFRKPSVTGVIKSQATGLPVQGVRAEFMNNPTPNEETGEDGVFYMPAVSSGTYTVMFDTYNVDGSYVAPDPTTVTVTSGSTYDMGTIYLETPMKTLKGYVRYPNGNPVTDAQVNCNKPMGGDWQSTTTNNSGYYELLIGKGTWQCMADKDWSLSDHEFDWVNFDMPTPISFTKANTIAEQKSKNFTVTPISSTIRGKVLKPDGTVFTDGGTPMVEIFTQNGFGNSVQTDSEDGSFSVGVPAGTYQVMVNLWSDNWGGPSPQTISVAANSNKNLGTLYLVPKNASISGTVTDSNGNGLANQYIDCFVAGDWGKWASDQTDSNGDFSFGAFGGATYQCSPMTDMGGYGGSGEQYLYLGAPISAALPNSNSNATGIDFEMVRADSTVNVTTVDENGDQVGVFGYAFVDQAGGYGGDMMMGPGVGAPVDNGTGTFKVPSSMCTAASPCSMSVATPPGMGAEYSSAGAVSFSVTANTATNVEVPMLPHNATISGQIQDTDGNAITNIGAYVFADNYKSMMFTETLVEADGSYSLSLAAGNYNMGAWLDPTLGYIAETGSASEVTAIANQTITKNITLRKIDSSINVTVLAPTGDPMPGVFVDASTSSGMHQAGDPGMMGPMMMGPGMMGQMTGSDGTVEVGVPGGTSGSPITYYVSASLPPGYSYINPSKQTLSIVSGDEKTLTMRFRESDATVSGGVTVDGNATGAYVTGWAEEGGRVEDFAFGGAYSLNVTQGDTWHITAKSKVGSDFYKSKEAVITPDAAMETLDLELQLVAANIPDPVTATFSANNPAVISLEDDSVTVNIPANAISNDSNDTIKVTVSPDYEVPDTDTDKVPTYGVEVTAYKNNSEVESQFNSNVTITQCWNEEQMENMGLDDEDLNSKYWDADVGAWKTPGSVATDQEQNCQTSSVNHLTTFSLTASELSAPNITLITPEDDTTVTVNSVVVAGTVSDPTATVTIAADRTSIGTVDVDSSTGAFSETVTDLTVGSNTITIDAENGVGSAETVTRTVTYSSSSEDELWVASGVELNIVTTPKDGGPQVRVFDNEGNLLESFFAYNEALRGEFDAITADLTGDGYREIITYPASGFPSHIRVFDHRGSFIDHFYAYQTEYMGGVEIKAADVDGDGRADLIVKPQDDGGANIRVYTYNTSTQTFDLLDWVMAYQAGYRGMVNMVVTDIDGDAKAEIITAPAENGGPNVRVYSYNAATEQLELIDWFMAYQESFYGGVEVAVANVYGDDNKEIIVAPSSGGGPNVRVYEYDATSQTFSLLDWFWAYQLTYRDGLTIKAADMNNSGLSDIITAPKNGSTNVRIFSYDTASSQFTLLDWFWAYAEDFRGGTTVSVANVDGDEYTEIVTIPQENGGPNVRLYEYNTATGEMALLDWTMAYQETFRGEIMAKVADLDGNGDSEIITSPLTQGGPNVRIFDYADNNFAVTNGFMAYDESFRGGVEVTTGR